jgi:hypothetical protein
MKRLSLILICIFVFTLTNSCNKDKVSTDTSKYITGIWIDTAYARFMVINDFPGSSDSDINTLMDSYFFSFDGSDGFNTGIFELNQHFGNYEVKNDSVNIYYNENYATARLKLNKTKTQMNGSITNYTNLHLIKLQN